MLRQNSFLGPGGLGEDQRGRHIFWKDGWWANESPRDSFAKITFTSWGRSRVQMETICKDLPGRYTAQALEFTIDCHTEEFGLNPRRRLWWKPRPRILEAQTKCLLRARQHWGRGIGEGHGSTGGLGRGRLGKRRRVLTQYGNFPGLVRQTRCLGKVARDFCMKMTLFLGVKMVEHVTLGRNDSEQASTPVRSAGCSVTPILPRALQSDLQLSLNSLSYYILY